MVNMSDVCPACKKRISAIHRPINCLNCKSLIHKRCLNQLKEVFYADSNSQPDCPGCGGTLTSISATNEETMPVSGEEDWEKSLSNMFEKFQKQLLEELDSKLDTKLDKFKTEVKNEILSDVNELKRVNTDLQGRIAELEKKVADFIVLEEKLQKVNDITDRMDRMEETVSVIGRPLNLDSNGVPTTVYKEIQQLQLQHEEINRYTRSKNLVICGVPEHDGEDPYDIVKKVGDALGVKCGDADIRDAHRLPRRQPGNGATKPIVVGFVCTWKRDELLKSWKIASRSKKLPRAKDLKLPATQDDGNNIYINEQLSAYNGGLHKKARDLRELGAKYVWTHMGRVLVRLDSNSNVVYVKSVADINSLKSELQANPNRFTRSIR